MGLNVSLISSTRIKKKGTGIFIRENGMNKELTVEEVSERFPDTVVEEVEFETDHVYSSNITHNLCKMAAEAGIYEACWRPEEINAIKSNDIIQLLEKGYNDLKSRPDHYKQFDSANGWGTYTEFLPWVESYLNACKQYPNSIINVSR